jgi:hypothetical protein
VGITAHDPNRSAGANKMYEWLTERSWTGSRRELSQYGPTWYRKLDVDQRDEILADLLRDELIAIHEVVAANNRKVKTITLQLLQV